MLYLKIVIRTLDTYLALSILKCLNLKLILKIQNSMV